MDDPFSKLITLLLKILPNNGQDKGFVFDGQAENLEGLFSKFDRFPLIQELKKRAATPSLPAKKWVPMQAKADFMSTAERDVRMRFRNRIQGFKNRTINNSYATANIERLQKELDTIEAS